MNKSKNTFLKSKMNKDVDARILPNNEYRNAVNVQVNKSEGSNVGSLENVLGNAKAADVGAHLQAPDVVCIGTLEDESTGITYLFFTNYTDPKPLQFTYSFSNKSYIVSFNSSNNELVTLVEGPFLNFSTTNPVYASNIVENLLFWTDNRNQPRKINVDLANNNPNQSPTYYKTEDQISVAKYNPYDCIEMYAQSRLSTSATTLYESTMKDVSSKNLPNGGNGELNISVNGGTQIIVKNFIGDIQVDQATTYDSGSSVSYIDASGIVQPITGALVSAASYDAGLSLWTIDITGAVFPNLSSNTDIILNANPYYDSKFAGDPTYLDDKFVRFGYRFKFEDNEYSLFSTFTQAAFIPKQDGYFMYVQKPDLKEVNNQSEASRSTIVNFVENKVDQIKLRIPLPFKNYNMRSSLKVTDIDILYKESDQIPVKVIDTISAADVFNASASCKVETSTVGAQTTVAVDNIVGGIKVGSYVTGFGITTDVTVTAYAPNDPNVNPSTSGVITLSSAQTLVADVELTVGEPDYHVYDYQSKKPFRTLPEKDLIRVYDKIPVRSLAQEISGNRVIYGNYQNKHTAPEFINYNLAVSDKASFNLNGGTAQILGTFPVGSTVIDVTNVKGDFFVGMIVISDGVAPGTIITNISGTTITIDTPTTGVLVNLQLVVLQPGGKEQDTTSRIEYPNSSLKTNRNYQVGVVLSDRYGRQSGVILSNNKEVLVSGTQTFIGSTIYSAYNTLSTPSNSWPGDSIKLIFNNQIATSKNALLGLPGVYNGDATSVDYNPLGWYTYKIVVKQTEQDYYNAYIPGIMAGYPENLTLEQGQTSHLVLTSDNINKIPRDLNEVGPTQDQFRSSVKLYGRVENSATQVSELLTNIGLSNLQYYPGREFDIAVTISPMNDLFNYDPVNPPSPNFFPQFYTYDSNPYIARISTATKIGQKANINYTAVTGFAAVTDASATIRLYNVSGNVIDIEAGDSVTGPGFPEDLVAATATPYTGESLAGTANLSAGSFGNSLTFGPTFNPGGSLFFVGQIVTGAGISSGTIVTDIIANGSPIVDYTVTLNQSAGVVSGALVTFTNAAQLIVSESVNFSVGDRVQISSVAKPGIQYLAVYETEPVKSLLDIFWESSTTGVIQDINNIILNENPVGEGAEGISPFNDNSFTEGLRPDPVTGEFPTITQAPFGLVNNFGSPIVLSPTDTPVSLDSVLNGYGEDVQTIYETGGVVTPVFSFAELGSSQLYDIRIAQGFVDNIWFGTDPLLYTFTFVFTCEINGLPSTFTKTSVLRNVAPAFYSWEETSVRALRTQTAEATAGGFKFDVYGETNSVSNVLNGFAVANDTNPTAFPSNLVTSGTNFTIPDNIHGSSNSVPNNVFPVIPTLGVTQTSTSINFYGIDTWTVFTQDSIATYNRVSFRPNFTTEVSSVIPEGTYVESFTDGAVGSGTRTATFNKSITTTGPTIISTNPTTGISNGDSINFFTPNYLIVDQPVDVTEGDLIYLYEPPTFNNCPIGPVYIGSANVEIVAAIQGVNGAGFDANDLFPANQNNQKWQDLTCSIESVTDSSGNDAAQYFDLANGGVMQQNSDGVGEVNLLNTGYENDAMPADVYTVTLRLDDPADHVFCSIIVNTGLKICDTPYGGPGKYGDAPFGVCEYTVTGTPTDSGINAGYQEVIRKYIVVSICEGVAGLAVPWGNGSNGIWLFAAGSGDSGVANPSWQEAINQNGNQTNIVIDPIPSSPNPYWDGQNINGGIGQICNGKWYQGLTWDDLVDPTDILNYWIGLRTIILQGQGPFPAGPCSLSAPSWAYTSTIVKSAGTGTGVPLNPPVENYVFTI